MFTGRTSSHTTNIRLKTIIIFIDDAELYLNIVYYNYVKQVTIINMYVSAKRVHFYACMELGIFVHYIIFLAKLATSLVHGNPCTSNLL